MENVVGDRLREQRKLLCLTQDELAEKVNVSGKSVISNYENGYSSPDLDTFKRLAKIFNCTTDYLLGLTNDPEAKMGTVLSEEQRKKAEIKKALASLVAHDKGEFPIESGLVDTIYEEMEKAKDFHNKRKSGDK